MSDPQPQANRAILLTPPGAAAIAVVRLLGPLAEEFLRRHFSKTLHVGRCVHGTLSDGAKIIDDPVVVLLGEGRGADLNVHGGAWVVRSVLDLAEREGFKIVSAPGNNAPLEAVDGSTTLGREIAAHLPLARTELGLRCLLAQPNTWKKFVAESPSAEAIRMVVDDMALRHLLHPPCVAIVGAANVGKSTLANDLFGQERSITADVPGTTRDWVGEIAHVDGLPVMLLDTPGQRQTEDTIERTAIERSRARIKESELVILVLDATRPLAPEQTPLLEAYPQALCIVNKCDCRSVWDESTLANVGRALPAAAAHGGQCPPCIHTVATSGSGVDELRRAISGHFGCRDLDPNRPRWWTDRQREILMRVSVAKGSLAELLSRAD